MTHKEKADELINRFKPFVSTQEHKSLMLCARQCALISILVTLAALDRSFAPTPIIDYYEKVKEEIQKQIQKQIQ